MRPFCRWKMLVSRTIGLIFLLLAIPAGRAAAQSKSSEEVASPTSQAGAPVASDFHEDRNSISISTSTLEAAAPLLGETDDVPQNHFVRQLYQVQWRPMDPLDLYVIRPRGVAKPRVILYLYSYPEDTERFKNDAWCTRVTSGGYAAIGFVSALTGHRYHDRPMKKWFVSELQEALATSAHDVQMILNYLQMRNDLDLSNVGIFTVGSGGSIAILAAAADPRIKSLDLLNPWGDWTDWLAKSPFIPEEERAKYVTADFMAQVAPLDPIKWLPKLTTQEIRMRVVQDDSIVPKICQEKMQQATPKTAEIIRYGDARALYEASAGGRTFDWIKERVQASNATSAIARVAREVKTPIDVPAAGDSIQ
jgi:hypothetical protein